MKSWRRRGMLVGMVALLMLALGAAASASTGQDGPSPPELGDPVNGTQVVPHGGYSSTTNFCMQCHDVHDAAGAYALMATTSVEATCSTCHSVGTGIPPAPGTVVPGGPDPTGVFPGNTNDLGTVSLRTVYDLGTAANDAASVHTLGRGGVPGSGKRLTQSDWDYGVWKYGGDPLTDPFPGGQDASTEAGEGTSADPTGGLYCASCHTPHGEYGQMVNNWVGPATDPDTGLPLPDDIGTEISYKWDADSPSAGDPAGWAPAFINLNAGSWEVCRTPGTPPTNCKDADIVDAEGQVVSLYGYKLLTAYPNHTYETLQTYNVEQYNYDQAGWCTACHTRNRLDHPTRHNHQTGCGACHGNPVGDPTSADFPHTSSVYDFLIDYPDALCVTCHTPGSLP